MSSWLWRVFDKIWYFRLPTFGLASIFPIHRSYSVSFGCWLHVSSQDTQNHAIPIHVGTDGTRYRYRPLKQSEIRLFVLEPGSDTDTISGHIEHASLGSNLSYEALSYVWGDMGSSAIIQIDGSTVSITKSLGNALQYLRYSDRPRTLWIDYICINQEDFLERSEQVRIMGSIYGLANCVLIWLGLATPYSPVGMEILRYFINEERPCSCPVWQTYPQSVVYQGLQDVLTSAWFGRIWVVQEAGRSAQAKLICGQDYVQWQSTDHAAVRHFSRMIKYAEILPEWKHLGLDAVNTQPLLEILDFQEADQFSKSWGSCERRAPDLLELAHGMRYKHCTNPRDKIFGIWGLVDYLSDLEDFKIDYSMTVKQVYEEVARVSFQYIHPPASSGANLLP